MEEAQLELIRVLPAKAARWTRREQFHLTLQFLGNVAVPLVEGLVKAVSEACGPFEPLRLSAARIGFFPDPRSPRVLWAGVKDPDEELRVLWAVLQSAAQPYTEEAAEKEFTGHVTLARLSRLPRTQVENLAKAAAKYEN